jgi:hypothetical protein
MQQYGGEVGWINEDQDPQSALQQVREHRLMPLIRAVAEVSVIAWAVALDRASKAVSYEGSCGGGEPCSYGPRNLHRPMDEPFDPHIVRLIRNVGRARRGGLPYAATSVAKSLCR